MVVGGGRKMDRIMTWKLRNVIFNKKKGRKGNVRDPSLCQDMTYDLSPVF